MFINERGARKAAPLRQLGMGAVVALNAMTAVALLLWLCLGPVGLFLFFGIWPLVALLSGSLTPVFFEKR